MTDKKNIVKKLLSRISILLLLGLIGCQAINLTSHLSDVAKANAPLPQPVIKHSPLVSTSPSVVVTFTPVPPTPTAQPSPLPSATPTSQPTETPTAQPAQTGCQNRAGTVATQAFDSQGQGLSEFKIYLPPCYNPASSTRYPVLYLLHGMNSDDQQWVRIGAPAAADRLIQAGKAHPFLIVMPNEDDSIQNADASTFDDALVDKLLPWIDQNYDTCAERDCRAIGGLSRGSGWAIRIGLVHWDLFGEIGAHSISLFDGDLDQLGNWVRLSLPNQHPRIYMDAGIYDQVVPEAESADQILTHMLVPHQWSLFDGAHNEDYWKAHVQDYLLWYAQGWNLQ